MAAAQAYAGTATLTLAADGVYTIAVRVFDGAGNSTVVTQQVRLDRTGAAIVSALGTGQSSYDVGSVIAFTYSASDVSGAIASATLDGSIAVVSGAGIDVDVDMLTAGTHTIVITAIDGAGNKTTTTLTLTIHASGNGLLAAINDGARRGLITAAEQAALVSQMNSVISALPHGNSASPRLRTFISMVQSQAGKSIDTIANTGQYL